MRHRVLVPFFGTIISACVASGVHAQNSEPPASPPPGGGPPGGRPPAFSVPRPTLTATLRSLYAVPTDSDGTNIGIARGGLDVQWADRNPLKGRFITLTGRVESNRYISEADANRNRFEDFGTFALRADTVFLRGRTRATVAGLSLEASAAENATFADGIIPSGYLGELRVACPSVNYTYGIFVIGQLEASPLILPLVGFEWQTRPNQLFVLRGTELRYTFGANPTFGRPGLPPIRRSVSFLLNVEPQRNFRLSRQNPTGNGVLRDLNIRLGSELTESLGNAGTASLFLGSVLYRRLQFDNADGDQVFARTFRPALSIGGNLAYRF